MHTCWHRNVLLNSMKVTVFIPMCLCTISCNRQWDLVSISRSIYDFRANNAHQIRHKPHYILESCYKIVQIRNYCAMGVLFCSSPLAVSAKLKTIWASQAELKIMINVFPWERVSWRMQEGKFPRSIGVSVV